VRGLGFAFCSHVGFALSFLLHAVWFGLVWFPAACVTADLMLDLLFIFIDPCAGRHLLLLLRQKK
jgi:hypothetical protein